MCKRSVCRKTGGNTRQNPALFRTTWGVTLIELLTVMAIINILSVVVYESYTASLDDSDPSILPRKVKEAADEFQHLGEGEESNEDEGTGGEGSPEGIGLPSEGELEEGEGAGGAAPKSGLFPKEKTTGLTVDQGDGVPDVVQMLWILAIDHGNTQLDLTLRSLVSGVLQGYDKNLSLLTSAVFLEGLYNQIVSLGAPPDQADVMAADLAEFFALILTVDPVYYGRLFDNTFVEDLLNAIGGVGTLSDSAMGVIGGQADPDRDGKTNAEEWQDVVNENYTDQQRIAAFTTSAERGDPNVPALSHVGLVVAIVLFSVAMTFIHTATNRTSRRLPKN